MDKDKMQDGFRNEAVSHTLYKIYGDKAKSEGLLDIAKLFYDTSENDFAHARMFFDEMNGDTIVEDDLLRAAKQKEAAAKNYKDWHDEEGDVCLQALSDVEAMHGEQFRTTLDEFDNGRAFSSDTPSKWQCRHCGFIAEGRDAPTVCPLCLGSQGCFHKM